jgi:hypothetical protein
VQPDKQRIPVTKGKEKAVLGRSVLTDCFGSLPSPGRGAATLRRCRDSNRLAPSEHDDEPSAVEPTLARSFGSGEDRLLLYRSRNPVERPGAHGFDPDSDSYRGTSGGLAVWDPRKHSSRPLQEQAQGSIGPRKLATAALRHELRQRNKALRPTVASGVGTVVRKPPTDQPQRLETARRQRPPVTVGQLLTREKASKGRA